ncbi:hypothetical protein [Arthrobacter globiformis]|uniref:hypothetical protein n=1 Tax=Arthrobacter globiformis TaxID=1665 RepID=UPI0027D79CAC|nr:hypothetical protein [Arthrobacter globiformis]
MGGDTVITFGSRLVPVPLKGVPADCKIGSVNCVQAATAGVRLNRVFAYSDSSHWGIDAKKCPRDRVITSNRKYFTVLVLPVEGTGCTSLTGRYDVVVVSGGSKGSASASGSLAREATARGMKFYAGMPSPANRKDASYLPDLSYRVTFSQFTDRFLQHQSKTNNVSALAGFYLSTEMPLSTSPTFNDVLTLYRIQNQAIRKAMPGRAAVVSPYLDARTAAAGHTTPAEARAAMRAIALTASGVALSIAVQDGMGTGKGGAYFGNESRAPVDSYAAAAVGAGTWGSKYLAPNRDYFAAAARGVAGTGAVLWANLEGMAPATGKNKCDANVRGQTTRTRIDRQLQQIGNPPQKVISFMWDSYYTCAGTGRPLEQQLAAGEYTPVMTDTFFDAKTGAVRVTGFNLRGAKIQLRWTNGAGKVQSKVVAATGYDPGSGKKKGMNPLLQSVTANAGRTTLMPGSHYTVGVTNALGAKNDAPYSKQG